LTSDARARRPRADFERNRSEILAQAERHFAAEGVGASLEAVARDAGVGSATLYRHFPTRDALLAEVLERRATQIEAEI
jgi:AcrR family transcriptional regulator